MRHPLLRAPLVLLVCMPALALAQAQPIPEDVARRRAEAAVDAAFPRLGLSLSLEGWRDRMDGGGSLQAANVSLRGAARLFGRLELRPEGIRAWGMTAQVDARAMTIDLDRIQGDQRFLRLGASLGGYFIPSSRTSYSLQAGAYVAEQEALLGEARVRPQAFGIGTYRSSERLRLLFGAIYLADLGFPVPILGATWGWTPSWRLTAVLPAVVRVTWAPRQDFSLSAGTSLAIDKYRYRSRIPPSPDELRLLRLRFGLSSQVELTRSVHLGAEAGVERSWIEIDGSNRLAAGAYAGLSLGFGARPADLAASR